MMINEQKQAPSNPTLKGPSEESLTERNLPTTNRTNVFSRMAGVAALSAALATNGVPARAQTNSPAEPNPSVAPVVPGSPTNVTVIPTIDAAVAQQLITTQVPAQPAPPAGAGPAPAPAMHATKSNITRLEKRPFCMTDAGKVIMVHDRESQVKREGSFVEGSPSTGTALQVLAYAKEHLEQMNGGQIPEGYKAKLYIRSAGAESSVALNIAAIPRVADLGQLAYNVAINDPINSQAVRTIHNGVKIHVVNDGGTFTMTFKNKFSNDPLLMTVELEKQ